MEWYVSWVSSHPLVSAFAQFALLGSAGELLGILASKRRPRAALLEWIAKALAWGILGILVKCAFAGFKGFLAQLVAEGFLPSACAEIPLLRAFCLSVLTNSMFGPLLMFLHRSSDNLISGSRGYAGIGTSLATLAWFWIPAHAITFALPHEYQIGLAALWSVALGLIMGFTKRGEPRASE
jgi:hypothetical protein